ncbi:MAG: hypothetical protein ACUVQR_08345, partial [Thermogutta sp.]
MAGAGLVPARIPGKKRNRASRNGATTNGATTIGPTKNRASTIGPTRNRATTMVAPTRMPSSATSKAESYHFFRYRQFQKT